MTWNSNKAGPPLNWTRASKIRQHPSANGNRPATFTTKIRLRRPRPNAAGAAASAAWMKLPARQARPAAQARPVRVVRPAVITHRPACWNIYRKRTIRHRWSVWSSPSFRSMSMTRKKITTCTGHALQPPSGTRSVLRFSAIDRFLSSEMHLLLDFRRHCWMICIESNSWYPMKRMGTIIRLQWPSKEP